MAGKSVCPKISFQDSECLCGKHSHPILTHPIDTVTDGPLVSPGPWPGQQRRWHCKKNLQQLSDLFTFSMEIHPPGRARGRVGLKCRDTMPFSLIFFGWVVFPLTLLYFLSIWSCPKRNFQGSHFKDAVRVVQNSSSEAGAEYGCTSEVLPTTPKSPNPKLYIPRQISGLW